MTDDGLVDFAANYVSGEAACMVIAKHFSRFLSGKDLFKMRSCGIRCIARLSLTIGWTYSSGEHGLNRLRIGVNSLFSLVGDRSACRLFLPTCFLSSWAHMYVSSGRSTY